MLEEIFKLLAESAVLGPVLVISIVANFFLYREIQRLQEKRITETKEVRDTMLEPIKAIQKTVDLILTLLQFEAGHKGRK